MKTDAVSTFEPHIVENKPLQAASIARPVQARSTSDAFFSGQTQPKVPAMPGASRQVASRALSLPPVGSDMFFAGTSQKRSVPHSLRILITGLMLAGGLAACGDKNPVAPQLQPEELTAAEMLLERPALTSKKEFYPLYSQRTEFLTGPALNEEQSRALLVSFADKNPLVDTKRALELFSHPTMKSVIAEPGLRAMYAGLNGLPFGDRSIEFLLNAKTPSGLSKVKKIAYGPVRPGLIAEVVNVANNGQMTIHFNPGIMAENPLLLAGYGVHELLHQDLVRGANGDEEEETIAHFVQTLVSFGLMVHNPELFSEPTPLTQANMGYALALSSTGLAEKLGILHSNGNALIFPNAKATSSWRDLRSFSDVFARMDNVSTPGNPLIQGIADELARISGTASCPAGEFNRRLVECMDRLIGDVSVAPDSPVNPFSVEKRANPIAEVLGIRGDLLAKAKAN